jgi:predicted molibdopterin-dependent oxidoreductase YjgC
MASIEGQRGMPRPRPPYPAQSGLWGKPTNINNVETWANVPIAMRLGGEDYARTGTRGSKGTKIFSLVGKINKTGLVEVPMGITLREIVEDIGGGIPDGKQLKAVQTGGPSGGCIPEQHLDEPVDYDSLTRLGSIMGSGGLIVMDETTCMVDLAHYFLSFTQDESCGKCTPCRIGTRQMAEILERIKKGNGHPDDLGKLEELAETVRLTSLCGLGQTAPNPVLTTLRYFRDEYQAHVEEGRCPALSCMDLVYFEINEDCVGCGICLKECPSQAITGEKKLSRQGSRIMIELSVDGRKVEVEEGASVLDAARRAGVYVPTLCYQPDLSPFGGCRMCVVEIEGVRGFPTSCTTPAEQGMVVRTDTEKVQAMRKGVLELLLTEHPSACLVCEDRLDCWDTHECTGRAEITTGCKFCPSHARCQLQEVVQHVTGEEGPTIGLSCTYRAIPVDRRNPFIDWDHNLCILCGRCVRACEEQSFTCTLDFMHRGGETRVGTAFGRTLRESGCSFCGACVEACPTGTISERVRRWEGPAQDHIATTCSFCSVGCAFELGVRNGRVIEALPRRRGEADARDACVRGRFAVVEFVRSVRRLKSPLVRRHGELIEVPWETALEAAAEGIGRFDPERAALVYSGSCSNEDIYAAHKFARDVLKTPHVDSSLRLSYAPLRSPNRRPGAGRGGAGDRGRPGLLASGARPQSPAGGKGGSDPAGAGGTSRHRPVRARLLRDPTRTRGGAAGARPAAEAADPRRGRRDAGRRRARRRDPRGREAGGLRGGGVRHRADASGAANRDLLAAVAGALGAEVLPLLSRANDRGAMEIAAHFDRSGLTAPEIFAAARSGEMDLLYLIGEELWPADYQVKFTVVQDMFLPTGAGEIADVVLPAASFAEIDGTLTNLEGGVRRLRRAIRPIGASKPDWEILSRLAEKLGAEEFGCGKPSEIMSELAEAVPFYQGATYEALEHDGAFFGRSEARGDRAPAASTDSGVARGPETPNADYPFSLVAEYDEYTYRATPLRSEVHGLRKLEPPAAVALSPRDAETLGVAPGSPVRVISRRGSASAKALPSEGVQQGVVRMVARGGDGSPTPLLELVLDPVSKAPEQTCAVRIERV